MPDENPNLSQSLCPKCGEPVDSTASHCPYCGEEFPKATLLSQRITPEMLTYRLGDFLVESGAITTIQLEQALEYQARAEGERHILLGQAMLEMEIIDRDTLDKAITTQLSALQEALQETNRQLETRIQLRTQDLESRLLQIRTAADITQVAISASNQEELLRRTVELIVERFGYYYTSLFLVDDSQEFAVIGEASGLSQDVQVSTGYRIEAGSSSIVGWVLDNRRAYVAGDVKTDELYMQIDSLPDTHSEVALPVMISEKLLAVLDIQHTLPNAFDPETVTVLQTIANHIATAIQNSRLLENTQNGLREISSLYQASHQLAQASTYTEVLNTILSSLYRSPYLSAIFSVDRNGLHLFTERRTDKSSLGGHPKGLSYPDRINLAPDILEDAIGAGESYNVIDITETADLGQEFPSVLYSIPSDLNCKSLALIPGWTGGKLELLIVLGTKEEQFTQEMLEPYCSLASMAILTLSKVGASQRLEKRLASLLTLNTVSQAVSAETDLNVVYQVIHREVTSIIGNVNFAIATYDAKLDSITVPYMFDGQTTRSVEAFPMGEGLTSIIIRTKKPLLLVEDTERKTRELGAKLVGKPAKSWLGVPLLIGGDVIGAILLQDLEQEGRFDEDDQRLLETLASQVAVAVRNARLLENSYKQAARQQQLYEITSKIRSSPNIPGILQTTASELSRALGARRARIELGTPSSEPQDSASSQSTGA